MSPLGRVWTFAVGEPATLDGVARALTEAGVDGATLTPAEGLWRGARERTVRVDVAGLSRARAEILAEMLRATFGQASVYVQSGGRAWLQGATA